MADFLIKAAETAFKSTIQDKVIKSLEPVIKENIKDIEVLKTKIDTELGTLSSTVKNLIPDTLKDTVDVIKIKGFVDSIDSSVFKKVFDDVIEQQSDDDLKSLNLTKEQLTKSIGGLPDDIKEIFKKHIDSVFGNKKTAETTTDGAAATTDTAATTAATTDTAATTAATTDTAATTAVATDTAATTAATTDTAATTAATTDTAATNTEAAAATAAATDTAAATTEAAATNTEAATTAVATDTAAAATAINNALKNMTKDDKKKTQHASLEGFIKAGIFANLGEIIAVAEDYDNKQAEAAAAAGGAKRKHRRKTKKNIRRNNNGKTRFGRTF